MNREPNSHASATAYIGYKIPGTLEPCAVGLPRQKPRHKWNLALPTIRHEEAFQIGRHTAHYHKIKRLETARESLPQPTVLKVEILADINLVPFSDLSPNKTGNVFDLHIRKSNGIKPPFLSVTVNFTAVPFRRTSPSAYVTIQKISKVITCHFAQNLYVFFVGCYKGFLVINWAIFCIIGFKNFLDLSRNI